MKAEKNTLSYAELSILYNKNTYALFLRAHTIYTINMLADVQLIYVCLLCFNKLYFKHETHSETCSHSVAQLVKAAIYKLLPVRFWVWTDLTLQHTGTQLLVAFC